VIAEIAIICATQLAALWLWLSVPRKELEQAKRAHNDLLERLDVIHKQASELQAIKNESASVKVSLGWTK
jgi:acetolactate synthase small subunit